MLILDIEENLQFANDFKDDYSSLIKEEKENILNNLKEYIFDIKKSFLLKSKKTDNETFKRQKKNLMMYIENELAYGLENKIKFIFKTYFSDNKIDEIIIIEPKKQKKFIEKFSNEYLIKYDNNTKFIIDSLLKILFIEKGYETIKSSYKKKFYNNHKIKTCIYCNRNYIFNLDSNGHVKGHIDHFYPKDLYPYFSMSYYNLIPCCSTCNYIKGTFDTFNANSISPYLRNNDKLFETDPVSNFEYKFKPFNEELLKKLKIEDIYNEGHTDIVNDLYIKFFHQNTQKYFNGLKKAHKELTLNQEDFYRFITNSLKKEKDFHKRSFSKMTYDIIHEEFESLYKKL